MTTGSQYLHGIEEPWAKGPSGLPSWTCPRQICYQLRFVLPDAQQAKTRRRRGLQQRETLFARQPSEETGEQISNPPPRGHGLGVFEIRNKEAGSVRNLVGSVGSVGSAASVERRGAVIGKRCGNHGNHHSAQTQLSYRSVHFQVTRWTLAPAQLKGQWSHLVLTSSTEIDTADSKFLEDTWAKHLTV